MVRNLKICFSFSVDFSHPESKFSYPLLTFMSYSITTASSVRLVWSFPQDTAYSSRWVCGRTWHHVDYSSGRNESGERYITIASGV